MTTSRESRPVGDRAASKSTAADTSKYRTSLGPKPQQAFDDETRRDAHLTAIAYAAGYRLAVRCARCGQWLVAEKSVRLHLGPVCAAKLGEQVVA